MENLVGITQAIVLLSNTTTVLAEIKEVQL